MAFTYFFRDRQTLEAIRDFVVPQLRTRRYIHIWDAGCAMGPEPFSLAIIMRENMSKMLFRNVTIHATDIDTSKLFKEIIEKGSYQKEQLKSVPPTILNRYFQAENNSGYYRISEEIRKSVSYQRHDLLSLEPIKKNLGLIVCKNVLLHFKEQERIKVIKMFHDSLEEEGFLVTEQTQKMPRDVDGMFEQIISKARLYKKVSDLK